MTLGGEARCVEDGSRLADADVSRAYTATFCHYGGHLVRDVDVAERSRPERDSRQDGKFTFCSNLSRIVASASPTPPAASSTTSAGSRDRNAPATTPRYDGEPD